MLQLTTFGGVDLHDQSGQRITRVMAQPRRFALLVYLAVEGRRKPLRRDVLLGMFWPEVSQERASRSLSQALLFLRSSMEGEVITPPGSGDVGINHGLLQCDATAFLTAIEQGRYRDAVSLYHGDFLRGFYVNDAADFEDWATQQRLHFRQLAEEAAAKAARLGDVVSQTSAVMQPAAARPRSSVTMVVTVVMLAGFLSLWGLTHGKRNGPAQTTPVLLVDDFEPIASPSGIGRAFVSDLLGELSHVPGIATRYAAGRLRVAVSVVKGFDPMMLRGSVRALPSDRYEVSATLLNGATGAPVAHRVFTLARAEAADAVSDFVRAESGRYYRAESLARGHANHDQAMRRAEQLVVHADSLAALGLAQRALTTFDQADSILAAVHARGEAKADLLGERANSWLARAWVYFRPAAWSPAQFRTSMARAVSLADSALAVDANSAAAYEVRGVGLHFMWQLAPTDSSAMIPAWREASSKALRTAVRLAPARARAWAFLSAAYEIDGDYEAARSAAERAYAANPFLEESSNILHRLVTTSLETNDLTAATEWCAEAGRRFTDSWLAADCRLQVLAWSDGKRATYHEGLAVIKRHLAQPQDAPGLAARLQMILGVVAAAAGLPADSALAIQRVALSQSGNDAELLPMRAWLWQRLNRPDSARLVLKTYVDADPLRRAGITHSRRFQSRVLVASRP